MEPFFHAITAFPTLPLTVLLGIVVGYWLFALVTGAAFEAADGAADAAAGGIKAVGEAAEGAVKGASEAVAGAIKGATESAAEVVDGAKASLNEAYEGGGLFSLLGIGRVPVTMSLSAAVLAAWTYCTLLTITLKPESPLLGAGLLGGSSVLGLLTAALVLRPFNKALGHARPARRRDALGQVCTITSGRVDASFGTATVDDGGAGLNVHVVCGKANQLKKGDRALLVEFDAVKDVYECEPIDWLLPQEIEALGDPARSAQVISSRVRRR